MLRGAAIGLRARHESDVPVLHDELYDDVATRSHADSRPWRPIPPGSADSPYVPGELADQVAFFSVVQLDQDELAGEALLWGIDTHNRAAHLGLALRPAFRGRGLGGDVVRVLCHYGFVVRGLHRLQIETTAGNTAMIRAATRAGFALEGTLRAAAWVLGDFTEVAVLGLLATEWAGLAAPDLTAPDLTAPDLTAPDLTAPDLTAPGVSQGRAGAERRP